MKLKELTAAMDGQVLVPPGGANRSVRHVVASDLMSDVLLVDREDMLLLTSLASDQVLRTAQIVGAIAVVVVNGKPLPSSMPSVAVELGIGLATSPLSKYDACVRVHAVLGASGR